MMTQEQAKSLRNGIYFIHWLEGGSVAAVGRNSKGDVWFAPTNWINEDVSYNWYQVEAVELITTQRIELLKRGME